MKFLSKLQMKCSQIKLLLFCHRMLSRATPCYSTAKETTSWAPVPTVKYEFAFINLTKHSSILNNLIEITVPEWKIPYQVVNELKIVFNATALGPKGLRMAYHLPIYAFDWTSVVVWPIGFDQHWWNSRIFGMEFVIHTECIKTFRQNATSNCSDQLQSNFRRMQTSTTNYRHQPKCHANNKASTREQKKEFFSAKQKYYKHAGWIHTAKKQRMRCVLFCVATGISPACYFVLIFIRITHASSAISSHSVGYIKYKRKLPSSYYYLRCDCFLYCVVHCLGSRLELLLAAWT